MVRARLAAAIAFVALGFVANTALGQSSPRDIWPQVTAAVDAGDLHAADQHLGELLDLGRNLGIRRFPLYAETAASLARQANRRTGERNLADWCIAAAVKLDPKSPSVAFSAADLAVAQSKWGTAMRELARGFAAILTDHDARELASANLIVFVCFAIFAVAAVFALVLFLRYGRPAAHDFRELLAGRFGAGTISVLAFSLIFLPVFLWLSPIWVMLFWYILFFGYSEIPEKVFAIVLLLLLAALAPLLDWSAYNMAGNDSPAVRAAQQIADKSYSPESLRRVRELTENLPQNPTVHLLLGSLELQDGDEQQALIHFRKAVELDNGLAGAHLSIGNIHFMHGDFNAAISQYNEAASADPNLAIAYYNHSVASGEIYKYDEQGRQLEEAKKHDRALVDKLLANASERTQKVVPFDLPVSSAWAITRSISGTATGKELFGNYATLDLARSFANGVTVGSVLAILLALAVWYKRKETGYAGTCMKCGRTFCYRCKSSRESATYCTQCIHIYLKRDGVSLDTKRSKLDEVQHYQGSRVRAKKMLATFFPGSGQIFDGAVTKGALALLLFFFFLSVALFVGHLAPVATPGTTMRLVIRSLAGLLIVLTWVFVSVPVYRQRPLA